MIVEKDDKITITCDKCGTSQTEPAESSNLAFYEAGWALRSNARKYAHTCINCKPKKKRRK